MFIEARVIGCLIEKQITTPDQYPLSLNALVNACNQKSNRDPVLDLDERTVQQTLDDLGRKHFVVEKSGFGSRVPKYQHRFCNTEYGTLKLDPQELAPVLDDSLPNDLGAHRRRTGLRATTRPQPNSPSSMATTISLHDAEKRRIHSRAAASAVDSARSSAILPRTR